MLRVGTYRARPAQAETKANNNDESGKWIVEDDYVDNVYDQLLDFYEPQTLSWLDLMHNLNNN